MAECIDCGVEIDEDWKVFCSRCYERQVRIRGGKKPVLYEGKIVPDDAWLWCLHCERFFQAREYAVKLGKGFGGRCPFCGAAGIGLDVYFWDDWPKQHEEMWGFWPKSVAEISYGMKCSLY